MATTTTPSPSAPPTARRPSLRGSATGLRTDAPAVLDGAGGRALASADRNGDGYADLAVGRPDVGDGGEISTFHGSADGLTTTGAPFVGRGAIPGESGDRLGASLAAGDTDGDGYADVLAGAPGEDVGTATDAGAALLLHGGPDGLTAGRSTRNDPCQSWVSQPSALRRLRAPERRCGAA
ncbi:VCBS repeat-containing protein [Streptomyces sp. NPDC050619]|uniref:VCBS repeat-containing protein n=1 Tax=Streptomyces sp. NPDC050619 TaxID=3157214 RepID=UPI0034261FB8